MKIDIEKYKPLIKSAVELFWDTRNSQTNKQSKSNISDTGNRSAVTGGKQLDGFLELLYQVAIDIGIPKDCLYTKGNHIPGFFRPTKDWDLLIISPNKKIDFSN